MPRSRMLAAGVALVTTLTSGLVVALSAPARAEACGDTFTGADGGAWGTASNWSNNAVPAADSFACLGYKDVVYSSGTLRIRSIIQGSLTITGGEMDLTGTDFLTDLTMTGGKLGTQIVTAGGVSTVNVTGTVSISNATLAVDHVNNTYPPAAGDLLVLGPGAVVKPGSQGSMDANETAIHVTATAAHPASLTSGYFYGTGLTLDPGASVTSGSSTYASDLQISGAVSKAAGPDTVSLGVDLSATTVHVPAGELDASGGLSAGTLDISGGATTVLGSTAQPLLGSNVATTTGSGHLVVDGGTSLGATTVADLTVHGGVSSFSGPLSSTAPYTQTAGTMTFADGQHLLSATVTGGRVGTTPGQGESAKSVTVDGALSMTDATLGQNLTVPQGAPAATVQHLTIDGATLATGTDLTLAGTTAVSGETSDHSGSVAIYGSGHVTLPAGADVTASGSTVPFDVAGVLSTADGVTTTIAPGLSVESTGTLDLGAATLVAPLHAIKGQLLVPAGSSISDSFGPTITGGVLQVDGALTETGGQYVNVGTDGALTGTGTVAGPVYNAGGEVYPGDSGVGTLTVTSYVQSAGALDVDISAGGSNVLHVSGTQGPTLHDTVSVVHTGGYVPASGASFDIVTCAVDCSSGDVDAEIDSDLDSASFTYVGSVTDLALTLTARRVPTSRITSVHFGSTTAAVAFSTSETGGTPVTYTLSCVPACGRHTQTTADPIALTGLNPGTHYTVTLVTSSDDGVTSSASSSFTTLLTDVALPASVTATLAAPSRNALTIRFLPVSFATSYTATCTAGSITRSVTRTASPIVVGGLPEKTTYSCSVHATNSEGDGPQGPAISGRPGSGPHVTITLTHKHKKITIKGTATISDLVAGRSKVVLVFQAKGSKKLKTITSHLTDARGRFTFTTTFSRPGTYSVRLPTPASTATSRGKTILRAL